MGCIEDAHDEDLLTLAGWLGSADLPSEDNPVFGDNGGVFFPVSAGIL